jgi:hypothetical protein
LLGLGPDDGFADAICEAALGDDEHCAWIFEVARYAPRPAASALLERMLRVDELRAQAIDALRTLKVLFDVARWAPRVR